MPRKTQIKNKRRNKDVSEPIQHSTKWFRWGESYTSFMMGIIVVIIAFLFVGSLAKLRHTQQISATNTVNTSAVTKALDETQGTQTKMSATTQKEYVIQPGDDLWSISEKFYNSGYNWVDIAKTNNLDNPDVLFAGNKLIIPAIKQPTVAQQTSAVVPTPDDNEIKTTSYTVQSGDSLWDIAVRAYADGYRWTDIAKANNLANPDLIFSGNILTLPR